MLTVTQLIVINNVLKRMINRYGTLKNTYKLDCWRSLYEENKDGCVTQKCANSNMSYESKIIRDESLFSARIEPRQSMSINNSCTENPNIHSFELAEELSDFNNLSVKERFWRSAAFIVGGVVENCFDAQSYICDVNQNGFFCDSFVNRNLSPADFPIIEENIAAIVNANIAFQRLDVDVVTAKMMFRENPFKLAYLDSLEQGDRSVVVYRCGDIVDISQTSLEKNSGQLKCLRLLTCNSVRNPLKPHDNSLQRVYGIAFPNEKLLKEWDINQEEAKKRDHRRVGLEQKLFFFHSCSTGSPFMLPNGTHICNKLIELIREQYWQRGFQEVSTPNLFNCQLWKTSGHWDLYQENLFKIPLENDEMMTLKPMNCPGHCLIYAHEERSYRSLPLRFADFGVLHRNESSGALTGLTRLRKFHQDDGHIFCRPDQVEDEIRASLDFLQYIYDILGFKYSFTLSTRPPKYLGETSMWDLAEQQLKDCLEKFDGKWILNPGDGAFYGPKIDITITDAMNREHQCATIQLDFQLPIRFDLKYTINKLDESYGRPVIIHRAILGSVERLMAIMIESNGGKWPFWLNPRQVLVVPVANQLNEYAATVRDIMRDKQFMCDASLGSDLRLNGKIRQGQLEQYNCILVVGEKEKSSGTVNLRIRGSYVHREYSIEQLVDRLTKWRDERRLRIEEHCD